MKCPYRKIITKKRERTVEEFGDCYGEECPYYGQTEWKMKVEDHRIVEKEYRPCCRKTEEKR